MLAILYTDNPFLKHSIRMIFKLSINELQHTLDWSKHYEQTYFGILKKALPLFHTRLFNFILQKSEFKYVSFFKAFAS